MNFPGLTQLGLALIVAGSPPLLAGAPTAYFVDGYHGGVYGHYPPTFTQYIVDTLQAHPAWKLNLEIEPETWDWVQTNTPAAYQAFAALVADQSTNGRVEFVNPAYAQSYLWNINGESVIQQLERGRRKLWEHFPTATFTTYSSEEPCFTSALPGILHSFGFQQAVLKNPNTCWGGYTRARGGELVNWIGPDGTSLRTVPRYAMENLRPGSTWETIGNGDTPEYMHGALAAGITHPVGMCLQDAGWQFGPWLEKVGHGYQPVEYILWRNYFGQVATTQPGLDWHLSQEDIQVSLVWGAQVLQRIAQQVRAAENQVAVAEKMAALGAVNRVAPWPGTSLDEAWRTLLLAQHHDCWIVPYNGRRQQTWADKVAQWTSNTCQRSESIVANLAGGNSPVPGATDHLVATVYNTQGHERTEVVQAKMPADWIQCPVQITDFRGHQLTNQWVQDLTGKWVLAWVAAANPLAQARYELRRLSSVSAVAAPLMGVTNGLMTFENNQYKMVLDADHGGVITHLLAKTLARQEWVGTNQDHGFNQIRGYFYERGRFLATTDRPARLELLESGPLRQRVRIHAWLGDTPCVQELALTTGESRIDCSVYLAWRENLGIGNEKGQFGEDQREQDYKPFYDDRAKLLVTFPVPAGRQEISKDAPFAVTASTLMNTFFDRWSGIKNNVILNWVDAYDPEQKRGLAVFTDHTTSYVHGADFPLGLTLQYSGAGLWGRDYTVNGPTTVHYALLPHVGDWETGQVWSRSRDWNEPLTVSIQEAARTNAVWEAGLWLELSNSGLDVPAMWMDQNQICVRLFNPSRQAIHPEISFRPAVKQVEWLELDGSVRTNLPIHIISTSKSATQLNLPPFGLATLRFKS